MIEIRIWKDPGFGGTNIYIVDKKENGEMYLAKPVEFKFDFVPEGTQYPEPTLKFAANFGNNFLNSMAEELVRAGYRDKAVSKDGEIKRMESHLADMRTLAFDKNCTKKNKLSVPRTWDRKA